VVRTVFFNKFLDLDTRTYLTVRNSATVIRQGQQVQVESYPGDYKEEGGVLVAHSIDQRLNGQPAMKISMEKFEINVPLEDSLFRFPEAR
jgi:hypothetical protein